MDDEAGMPCLERKLGHSVSLSQVSRSAIGRGHSLAPADHMGGGIDCQQP